MNRFIIEHLGLLRVLSIGFQTHLVAIMVYVALKNGDLRTISLTLPIGHGMDFCNSEC